jgi:hypothetical protein
MNKLQTIIAALCFAFTATATAGDYTSNDVVTAYKTRQYDIKSEMTYQYVTGLLEGAAHMREVTCSFTTGKMFNLTEEQFTRSVDRFLTMAALAKPNSQPGGLAALAFAAIPCE